MTVRGKFVCVKTEHVSYDTSVKYTFAPRYDTSIPEDQRFNTATPSGEFWMSVNNPAVAFELGKAYYLDITEAPAG